jgi:hypothetical protein
MPDTPKTWILYAKRGDRWQHNNRDGADMIAFWLGRIKAFLEKPELEFGTEEDIPPQGDPDSSVIDMNIHMDDGQQLNLLMVVNRTVHDIENG